MTHEHIARYPNIDRCQSIVEEFLDEEKVTEYDLDRYILRANIPFQVKSKRITLDIDKVNEKGLFCPEEECWEEYGDGVIRPFRYGGQYAESLLVEDPDVERELYLDQIVRNIARMVFDACQRGFITGDVYGERDEIIDREPPTIGEYVESDDVPDVELSDTERRTYKVGTKRYGIGGVVTNRTWWQTITEQATTGRSISIDDL